MRIVEEHGKHHRVDSCTGVIIGKDCSKNGTWLFGRSEDLEVNHNKVFLIHKKGEYKEGTIIEDVSSIEGNGYQFEMPFDSFAYTSISDTLEQFGKFDEAGFNEYGLMVDMTVSATSNKQIKLVDPYVDGSYPNQKAGLSEAILPTLVLTTCKTPKEALELLFQELSTKGASEGNTFVIADQNDLYYMEVYSGHQFACIKYPKDKISVFPNTYYLGEVCLKDFVEEEYCLKNEEETIFVSKEILKTAKKAHSLVGNYNQQIIHLARSYRPANMKPSNLSRYESGLLYLDEFFKLDLVTCPFFMATEKKFTVEDLFGFFRNRMEHMNIVASDDVPERFPVGNRETLEAHVFEVSENLPKETPGVLYVALGSPQVSPFVAYYPNQTEVLDQVQNPKNQFTLDSMYWVAMDLLHMVETNRSEFQKLVLSMLQSVQPKLVVDVESLSAKEATEKNLQDAKFAYQSLLNTHQEVYRRYQALLKTKSYSFVYPYHKEFKKLEGAKLTQLPNTARTHYHLEFEEVNHGTMIHVKDPYGEEMTDFEEVLRIELPSIAFHRPYVYLQDKKYPLRKKGTIYEIKTLKMPLLIQEDRSEIPLVLALATGALAFLGRKKKK